MSAVLLRGGLLVDEGAGLNQEGDLLIAEGRIEAAHPGGMKSPPKGAVIEDVKGCWVLPGFIDLYAHLRQPGREDQETIATGLLAAGRGGYAAVAALPDTRPPLDSRGSIDEILKLGSACGGTRLHAMAALTRGLEGERLTDFADLAQAGCLAFTDADSDLADADLMRRALEYARLFNRPVVVLPQDARLAACGVAHEGKAAVRMGLRGIPAEAETTLVARDLELARLTGGWVHFSKLSCARSVELVRAAKAAGITVTCGVSAAHLAWSDAAIEDFDTNAKVCPPLRDESDREGLIEGLREGVIDCVVSDHAPITAWEKEADFDSAPPGMSSLETAFALAVRACVDAKRLSLPQLVAAFTRGPAAIANLPGGKLEAGAPADIAVVRPGRTWTVQTEAWASRGTNTLLAGQELSARVEAVYVGGARVALEG